MMRIRMLLTAAGPDGVWPAGAVVDVDEETGRRLVRAVAAVEVTSDELRVTSEEGPEAAAVEPRERAVVKRPRGRKGA